MWTLHQQQQHCGAQLHARGTRPRQAGEAPSEATAGREAQEHDRAGDQALPSGDYPASPIENADHDNTPTAPEARVAWDDVVQPEHKRGAGDQPLPDGK